MIWLTWRQFRIQATAVYAVVAGCALALVLAAPDLVPGVSVFDQLTRTDRTLYFGGLVAVALAPAVVGAFWGAPLVARELEAGTHRLVWAQSVTRTRWLATKLGVTVLAGAAAVGALTLAVSWWARPLDGALSETHGSLPARLTPVSFAMRGIAPVGYAVLAVVLGVTVGLVLRRTVPAMAVTLVLFTAVQIAVPLWVRPHLVTPVRQTVAISESNFDGLGLQERGGGPVVRLTVSTGEPGAWVLSDRTVDPAGRATEFLPTSIPECLPPEPVGTTGVTKAPSIAACLSRLTAEGYRQQLVYQPADRFWALQWRETGLFLLVSGLLAGFCFWWVRRV